MYLPILSHRAGWFVFVRLAVGSESLTRVTSDSKAILALSVSVKMISASPNEPLWWSAWTITTYYNKKIYDWDIKLRLLEWIQVKLKGKFNYNIGYNLGHIFVVLAIISICNTTVLTKLIVRIWECGSPRNTIIQVFNSRLLNLFGKEKQGFTNYGRSGCYYHGCASVQFSRATKDWHLRLAHFLVLSIQKSSGLIYSMSDFLTDWVSFPVQLHCANMSPDISTCFGESNVIITD